ncbi:MAG: hypothetical protein CV088_15675 [Nitrospira sp. LK70]|nr:hypothetical protein [Nitrospira sp. LK70]
MRLPLEGLFLHLVRSGFPLSVRDYEDALVALRLGHGTLTRDRLQWLCETLWVHTDEERIRLTRLFRDLPQPTPEAIRTMTGVREQEPVAPASSREIDKAQTTVQHNGDQEGDRAPLVEFASAAATGGVGLPQAVVPSTLRQSHILTPRPSVSLRQMIVTWRRFRLARRFGPKVQLDIDATIAEKSRCGTLIEPVLVPARRNQARLLVLFDASPSMVPWRSMGKAVADSFERSQLGYTAIYYFNNDPADDLFDSDRLTRPRLPQDVAREHQGCALLVVGDAGAARGRTDRERVRSTRRFVLVAHDASWWPIAWLNPMPRSRWAGSSAARIATIPGIAMFELTEDGLVQAVDHLRGKGRH